jgi:DNA polymerase-3 subunit beta
MKIKCSKDVLMQGVQAVQNVVSPKITLPILSNILLETKKNTLYLTATDLDIGISCEIPVEVILDGAITVPAKRFSDIIKELPSGDVVVHAKKNYQVDIEGNNFRFKLIGMPKDEFPKFPEFKEKDIISIEQKTLKEMLRLTSFAVSHEESRYVLNGVLLEVAENKIRLVATDGRRLAKIERVLSHPTSKEITVIIPIKAIQEINRNLKDEGNVILSVGLNQVLFDVGGILIATRIIEGEFPNYQQVIPKSQAEKIVMNRQDFLSSIRRANLLSTPDFQAVKFEVFNNKMVISKTTPEVGESREEIPIEYGGSELVVGFNPHFMIDVLKNIEEEQIHLELLGTDKPGIIRLKDYLYLALPMRI